MADSVALVDDAQLTEYNPESYLAAIVELSKPLTPLAVLLGNDAYSQELAPRIAHRLGGSSAGDAVDVQADGGKLRVTRGVYGGKATAVIALAKSPGVVWVRARALAPADTAGRAAGEAQKGQRFAPRAAGESR